MPTGVYNRSESQLKGYWKDKKISEEHKKKISLSLKGKKKTLEHNKKVSEALLRKNLKGWKHTPEARKKISEAGKDAVFTKERCQKISDSKRGKSRPMLSGSKHHSWRGGVTPLNKKIRMSMEMDNWRRSVFIKDNFTCQKTGIRGGDLVVHHILNFAQHPELRFAIDNGVTLSKDAHVEFHKRYGRKDNTRGQVEEFIGRPLAININSDSINDVDYKDN
jgi:hypothetical protein